VNDFCWRAAMALVATDRDELADTDTPLPSKELAAATFDLHI
jgi:hypothetical protein